MIWMRLKNMKTVLKVANIRNIEHRISVGKKLNMSFEYKKDPAHFANGRGFALHPVIRTTLPYGGSFFVVRACGHRPLQGDKERGAEQGNLCSCLDEYTKSNHRWKSCKRGGGNFQKQGRGKGIRQNHKGKKCGFDRVLTLFLYFWAGAKTAVFLYMVHDIISPVIKFYKELSTLSTKFSTPFKPV